MQPGTNYLKRAEREGSQAERGKKRKLKKGREFWEKEWPVVANAR